MTIGGALQESANLNCVEVYGLILQEPSRNDVLRRMSSELVKQGLVHECYGEQVIQREELFPTGVPTLPVPVAIPHSERSSVMKSGIAVAKLRQPVNFKRMDNPAEELEAHLVFLLAIARDEEQLQIIMKIMRIVQDQEVLRSLLDAKTGQEIERIIIRALCTCATE